MSNKIHSNGTQCRPAEKIKIDLTAKPMLAYLFVIWNLIPPARTSTFQIRLFYPLFYKPKLADVAQCSWFKINMKHHSAASITKKFDKPQANR
jgi:hypothetical protein